MADNWNIYVRDGDGNRVAEADACSRFSGELRFNAAGKWTLDMPYDSRAAQRLTWKGGVVVTRNDAPVFSGPVKQMTRNYDESGDNLVATGEDDLALLATRRAAPVPAGPPYTSAAYDVRTGAAETVLKEYVDYNLGPSAKVDRRWPGLTVETTAGTGLTVTGRARFHVLLPFLANLALAGGDLGLAITDLVFQVYTPADKTATCIFSTELGNVTKFSYAALAPKANHIICGGSGSGAGRTFYESGDSTSKITYGRLEKFLDKRDTAVAAELAQGVTAELAGSAEQWSASVTASDLLQMRAIDDYGLGDRVTCNLKGTIFTGLIRTLQFSLDQNQALVTPVIGTPTMAATTMFGKLFSLVQATNQRLDNLEIA